MRTTSAPALVAAAVAALATAAPAAAQPLAADPVGDFLAGYTGPRNAELDVVGAQFVFTGSSFRLVSRSAGPLSTSSGAVFVWGIDRGRGTAGFAGIGITGVLFDAVVVVNPTAGTAVVNDLNRGVFNQVLPVGSFVVTGDRLDVTVPTSFLPMLAGGFASMTQYTANLWPRSAATGGTAAISDFAPDNSNLTAQVVPEPGTAALVLPVAALLAAAARRRRRA
jgi:hypothetical protein